MRYLALGFVQEHWSSKTIWLPWSAKDSDTFVRIRKIGQDLGTGVDGIPNGTYLYIPFEKQGSETWGTRTFKYCNREPTDDEIMLINELWHLAQSSYDLYDMETREPRYEWADECKVGSGPSNPQYLINQWSSHPEVEEFVIFTEVPLGLPIQYSVRFYLSPATKSQEFVNFLETKLQFSNIQLAGTNDYGFATTSDELVWKKLNKKTVKVPDVGLILFDYVTGEESGDENSNEIQGQSDDEN